MVNNSATTSFVSDGFWFFFLTMVKLHISDNFIIIVSYQEFFAFSLSPNKLSWNFQRVVKCIEHIPKSDGSIECCAFSPCGKYFGICFDKNIIIYDSLDWSTLHICPGERKASSLQFFPKLKTVVIADRSGCATFYSFENNELKKTELALGHNSMLTGALITESENYVLTSDRDEKIRVSNYPDVYNIERYCLGHTMFVSFIGFLPTDERILISCSGDGTVRFWDFILGQQLALFDCNDDKKPEENSKATIIKFVSSAVDEVSVIAVLEYKSNKIKIITVKGELNTSLKIELKKVITLTSIPWDIGFHKKTLLCLMPDKSNPLTIWSSDLAEPSENFTNISQYLSENWDSFINTCKKIPDEVPVLFKREVDNLQEYEQRKRARLLKTGKTS